WPQAASDTALEDRLTTFVNQGNYTSARSTLNAANPSKADTLLLEGRIAKSRNDIDAALALLERALRLHPNDLRIRREYAHTLYLAERFGRASYHLNRLLATEPDANLRAGYRRLQREINTRRPFQWQAFFSIEPSTNVNRGTSNATFSTALGELEIDEGTQAQSGVGVSVGLNAGVWLAQSERRSTRLQFSYATTRYSSNSRFDSTLRRVALVHQIATGQTRWTLSPFESRQFRNDENNYQAFGFAIGAERVLPRNQRLGFFVSTEDRDFSELPGKSGAVTTGTFAFSQDTRPDLTLRAGLSFEVSRAQTQHLAYDGLNFFVGASKTWAQGTLYAGQREFRGPFPLTTDTRGDNFVGLNLSLQVNRWFLAGLSPVFNCRLEHNRSNIALFDYEASGCGVRLTRNF
ncbi:MAG: surface lipoprotein assembly modifier, partial [Pseudomonadota bacterium]